MRIKLASEELGELLGSLLAAFCAEREDAAMAVVGAEGPPPESAAAPGRRSELLKLVGEIAPIPDGAGVDEVVGIALGYLRAVDGALKSEGLAGELETARRDLEEATQKALRDSLRAQRETIDHLRAERDRLQGALESEIESRIAREAEG